MRALRISHSGVVGAWRQRDRELIALGVDVELLCAAQWEEGGGMVRWEPGQDPFVVPVRTFGRHPNLFLFDPRPLWKALRDRSFEVIDIHEEPFGLATGEILLLKALCRDRRPYVLYSAQNLDKLYPFPFSAIERYALHRAAAVQVCNEAAGSRLRRRGLQGDLVVLALGVDLDQFYPVDRAAPGGAMRVGYVGRLAWHKGVHVLLDAVAPLTGWCVELVGDGPEREHLAEQARSLGLGPRLMWHGHASQGELAAYYRSFDVLVVPSIPTASWTEQFGRVVVEAMASGVPVVSSDAGALPEVVGDAGLVVRAGDPVELRGALEGLAADHGRWFALRNAGLVRARQFTWSSVAREQLELYKRILASHDSEGASEGEGGMPTYEQSD